MTWREQIASRMTAPPTGAYSPAIDTGHFIVVSSQTGVDPGGKLIEGSAAAQAERALENVRAHLTVAGLPLDAVVKLSVFLTDLDDEPAVDAVLAEAFSEPYPARTLVQVTGLPAAACVAIEALAQRY